MVSCGGLAMATGLDTLSLRDLQPSVAWTPPVATPTSDAPTETPLDSSQSDGVDELPGGLFRPGDVARNITASLVNIRQTPGYQNKPPGDIAAQIMPGERVEIIGGRARADNLDWWLIRYAAASGEEVSGWVAEATASGVQILGF